MADSTLTVDSTSDSTNGNNISFPSCEGCKTLDTLSSLYWSFKIANTELCGTVTNTVASIDGTALTFFGPSVCSADSGLIITAFFNNEELNNNQSNLKAQRASLEYYDNINQADVLQSKQPNVFTMTIDEYIQQTGIAKGQFNGIVIDKNGFPVKVEAGRFKIKF